MLKLGGILLRTLIIDAKKSSRNNNRRILLRFRNFTIQCTLSFDILYKPRVEACLDNIHIFIFMHYMFMKIRRSIGTFHFNTFVRMATILH